MTEKSGPVFGKALQIVVGETLGSLNVDQKNVFIWHFNERSNGWFGQRHLDIYRNENGKFICGTPAWWSSG